MWFGDSACLTAEPRLPQPFISRRSVCARTPHAMNIPNRHMCTGTQPANQQLVDGLVPGRLLLVPTCCR